MTTYTCEYCDRDFATEAGLIGHLEKLHADREKTSSMMGTNEKD